MAWRKQISFTDRFENVKNLFGGDVVPSLAEAQALERQLFTNSESLEDYQRACDDLHLKASADDTVDPSDDNESDEESSSKPSTTIGQYIDATYHRDGLFASVYKAKAPIESDDPNGHQIVALKVTTPSMMVEPHDSKREVRILRVLKHEHIIPLLDEFPHAGGRLVLVFPFLPYDLQSLLDKQRINQSQARSHLNDMFSALAFLHSKGIIHRDIKPSNILLRTPAGPAYLADFGIALAPGDPSSEKVDAKITDVGTTAYRPPELLFGHKAYDTSLDLWAAGCVAAELVTLSATSLFDAGDLGSELALIQSIFKSLGTPNLEIWPEAVTFPDWGKMAFHEYPPKPWSELLFRASDTARDMVSKLVCYESSQRLPAPEVLQHAYFQTS